MGNATRKERYDVDIQGDSAIEGGSVFYDGGDYFLRLDLGITIGVDNSIDQVNLRDPETGRVYSAFQPVSGDQSTSFTFDGRPRGTETVDVILVEGDQVYSENRV